MKCPKCGYHSFEYLDNCRKCAQDLSEHKEKFNLHGFFSPQALAGQGGETAAMDEIAPANAQNKGDVDFGFDFLDDDEPEAADFADMESTGIDLTAEDDDLNIARPFDIDSESIPAGESSETKDKDSGFEF